MGRDSKWARSASGGTRKRSVAAGVFRIFVGWRRVSEKHQSKKCFVDLRGGCRGLSVFLSGGFNRDLLIRAVRQHSYPIVADFHVAACDVEALRLATCGDRKHARTQFR